jgi:hypothetical protein
MDWDAARNEQNEIRCGKGVCPGGDCMCPHSQQPKAQSLHFTGDCLDSQDDCCALVGGSDTSYRNYMCCKKANLVYTRIWSDSEIIYSQRSIAFFSSVGLAVGDRIKPDILAPGDVVISANSNCDQGPNCGTGIPRTLCLMPTLLQIHHQ